MTETNLGKIIGPEGPAGKSAYQYAQDGGFEGSEQEFAEKLATEYPTFANLREAAPVNLLDNSDFRNPVNQRGKATYNNGYTIDRWKSSNEHINVVIGEGKITLSKSESGGGFDQILPFDTTGKKLTLAVKTGDGLFIHNFPKESPGDLDQFPGIPAYFGIGGSGTNSTATIYFSDNSAVDVDIYWMALYEGEYTEETLPEYCPKSYAEELAECQRYYLRLVLGGLTGFVHSDKNSAVFNLDIPTIMRVTPTITLLQADNLVGIKTDGGSGVIPPTSVSVSGKGPNFRMTVVSTLNGFTSYSAISMFNTQIELNADL